MNHEQNMAGNSRSSGDDTMSTTATGTGRVHGFPAFLDLAGHQVTVVGGGRSALRKALRFVDSGAVVSVIASELHKDLSQLIADGEMTNQPRTWCADDFSQAALVIAASGDAVEDRAIASCAQQQGCWVNVANQPEISSFLIPSLVDRAPLKVAISSGGTSPILARLLTARIEAFLPHTYSQLASLADRYRQRIRQLFNDRQLQRQFWERALAGRVGELMLQGRTEQADKAMEKAISAHTADTIEGEVYLVGAGPGDPDLLSFRALRLMQLCDVVLYDRLVSEPIMALVNSEAEHIYVGKRRNDHAVPQESINSLLVKHAKQGKRVLRLKGGDPFIFGRGGEEIETLAAENVAFQVVPGITAAAGCASYAGIPLTHRDHAQSCLFVTGNLKDGSVELDWPALTRQHQTVVIYMGLVGLPVICEKLIEHGLPASHPIALVAQGTRADQQVLSGTLGTLPELVQSTSIQPPTLIIVGEVVRLREQLAWFESHLDMDA